MQSILLVIADQHNPAKIAVNLKQCAAAPHKVSLLNPDRLCIPISYSNTDVCREAGGGGGEGGRIVCICLWDPFQLLVVLSL